MIEIFIIAFMGAITSDLLALYKVYSDSKIVPEPIKNYGYWVVTLFIAGLAGSVAIMLEPPTVIMAFFIGFSVPLILRKVVSQTSNIAIEELEKDLEEAEQNAKAQPEKSKPVWEVSRIQLEMYISRNQSQVRSIYWITLIVMLAGFVLIGYGVFKAINESGLEAAILSTCSGIITEFIGATLLVIYKSTISQAASYVGTLERINSVGMALQIVDQIPDGNDELKNKARVELASKIVEARSKESQR